jgi:hypothetical protein
MMSFEPSRYSHGYLGAVDPALVSQLISAGTSVANTAIASSGKKKKGGGRRQHADRMQEIAAGTPGHSPTWPIAAGIGAVALAVVYVFTRPKAQAAAA